ncbi:TetR/AcrR family transcriptional regulator [Blastococcus sp. SYSU D01042]
MPTEPDALLAGAAQLLALRPAASMEEIAAAAGISRATLFRRFPSRAALVSALSERALTAYVDAVDRARPEEDAPVEALGRVLGELATLAPDHGLLVLQPLDEHVERALLVRARTVDDRLTGLVRRGQERGDFRVDLPAEWVLTALTWLVVGAADGLRLGTVAPAATGHLLTATVLGFLRR